MNRMDIQKMRDKDKLFLVVLNRDNRSVVDRIIMMEAGKGGHDGLATMH